MTTFKSCSKCKEVKDKIYFYNDKKRSDGKTPQCKDCMNKQQRESGIRKSEKRKAYAAEYYQKNRRKILLAQKMDREANPEKYKKRYKRDADKIKAKASIYYQNNKERVASAARTRYHKTLKHDEVFKSVVACRRLISNALSAYGGARPKGRTHEILGYSPTELKKHIEDRFLDGMSWSNRSDWHIDHIIPITEMIKLGVSCPMKINALSNLRPIWAADNLSKSGSFELVGQYQL